MTKKLTAVFVFATVVAASEISPPMGSGVGDQTHPLPIHRLKGGPGPVCFPGEQCFLISNP
jgi:hypothetical protein